jgi:hypothetical protein
MPITNSDIAQAWLDGQTDIDGIVSGIVPNTTFDTFINPRFKTTLANDCKTLYLKDGTFYDELTAVDPNDVTISVELFYQDRFIEISSCPNAQLLNPGGQLVFELEHGDGKYCARITMTYNQPNLPSPPIVWTKTFDQCIEVYCCRNKVVELKKEIECRIADISCRINKYACVGRNTTSQYQTLHRLQNILWCLCNFSITCHEYEIYACDVNRLKSC